MKSNKKAAKKPQAKAPAKASAKKVVAKKNTKPAPKAKKPTAKPVAKKAAPKPVAKKVSKPATKKAAPKPVAKKVSKPVAKKAAPKPVAKKPTPKPSKKVSKPIAKKAAPKPAAKKAAPKKVTKVVAKKAAPKKVAAKPVAKKPTPKPAPKAPAKKVVAKTATKMAPAKPVQKAADKAEARAIAKASPKPPKISVEASKKVDSTTNTPFNDKPIEKVKPVFSGNAPKKPIIEDIGKTRYSDSELIEFRELINEKLAAARKESHNLQEAIQNLSENGSDDTDNSYKTLEDGSSTMEKEHLSQMAARQRKYIDNLEAALVRIENKTYGICSVTGKLIPKERLRAVPHTTQSIEAKLGHNRPF